MFKSISIAALLTLLVGSIIISPNTALQASLHGFTIWWTYVFPCLLPMYLLFEMLKAFGLIHALQYILSPIFKSAGLSLTAGSSLIVSVIAGNPAGSEHTAKLLHEQKITALEAKKLYLYSYLPNPVFVFVVVGAGFFGMPALGFIIMLCIWSAALITMLIHSLFTQAPATDQKTYSSLIHALETGQREDGRSLGKLLGEGIYVSVQKLFITGGFMLFASVVGAYLQLVIQAMPFSLSSLIKVDFFLEPHLSSYNVFQAFKHTFNLKQIAIILCFILSIGGLTTLLEAFTLIKQARLSVLKFVGYRLFQALLSVLLCSIAWTPIMKLSQLIYGSQTIHSWMTYVQPYSSIGPLHVWISSIFISTVMFLALYTIFLTASYIKDKQA